MLTLCWIDSVRKISKIGATRCQILKLECTKFDFRWGSAPDPDREAYSAPQTPSLYLRGPTSKWGKGSERGTEGRREREGVKAGGRGGLPLSTGDSGFAFEGEGKEEGQGGACVGASMSLLYCTWSTGCCCWWSEYEKRRRKLSKLVHGGHMWSWNTSYLCFVSSNSAAARDDELHASNGDMTAAAGTDDADSLAAASRRPSCQGKQRNARNVRKKTTQQMQQLTHLTA